MSTNPQRHPVPAVAAVIAEGGRILLIRRAVEPSKGRWSVPGGSVEWGESLTEAVKREVSEETGLEVEVGEVAGVFDLITDSSPPDAGYHYVVVDYFARAVGGELRPGDDAAETRWVELDELAEYELTPRLRERLGEMGIFERVPEDSTTRRPS